MPLLLVEIAAAAAAAGISKSHRERRLAGTDMDSAAASVVDDCESLFSSCLALAGGGFLLVVSVSPFFSLSSWVLCFLAMVHSNSNVVDGF